MSQEPQLTPAQQALTDFFNEFAAAPTAAPGMLQRGYDLLDEAVEENRRLTDSITDASKALYNARKDNEQND